MIERTNLLFHSRELEFLEGKRPIPSSYRFFPFEQLPSSFNSIPFYFLLLIGFLFFRTVFLAENSTPLKVIGFISAVSCFGMGNYFFRKKKRRAYLVQHPNDPFFRRGFYAHESHWILWTDHQFKGTWEQLEVKSTAPTAGYAFWRYYIVLHEPKGPFWVECKKEVFFHVKTVHKEAEKYPKSPFR